MSRDGRAPPCALANVTTVARETIDVAGDDLGAPPDAPCAAARRLPATTARRRTTRRVAGAAGTITAKASGDPALVRATSGDEGETEDERRTTHGVQSGSHRASWQARAPATVVSQRSMKRAPLLPIFLTVFVDVLGLTLVLPLLPFYALHFGASPFVVGCLAATYAVCQLVSGPILGRISDQVGRKPTLLASQLGTFVGFLVLGFANALWMLFASRIIDGSTAGNLSIAQAYISDATKPEERTKAFGFIGIAFGTGFLLGPAVSGWLAKHHGYAAPAFAAAGLSFLSIVLTATMLPNQVPATGGGAGAPRRSLAFGRFLGRPRPRRRLLEFFAFTTSFSTLIGGLALYLKARFGFDVERTGYVYALSGLVGAAVQGGIIGRLARSLGEARLSLYGFLCMTAGYAFLGAAYGLPLLVVLIVVAALGSAVTRPALTTLLTRSVESDEQGAVLGVSQSLAGISQIMGPVVAGFLIGHGWLAAYGLVAAGAALVGATLVRVHERADSTAG